MDAVVSIPGAEPWSVAGSGIRGSVGVIVIHGFTGNPVSTRPLGQRLAADGYTVEVPLLPGHGTHHRDLGKTRYVDWVGSVERVLEHLRGRCDQVVLVGHSMGGTIALDLASRRGADVAAVAVINPPVLDPPEPLAKLSPLLQFVVRYLPRDLAGLPTNDIAQPGAGESAYGMVPTRAAGSLLAELARIRGQLVELTQPLLIVWSPDDHTVPARNARDLPEFVGSIDVRRLVCERSYHVPQLDYDAALVGDGIADFVADSTGT